MRNKAVICGNGNLVKYLQQNLDKNSDCHVIAVWEQIELIQKEVIDKADIVFLAVSWHETEKWVARLQETGANEIYRVPVHMMQYRLPVFNAQGEVSNAVARILKNEVDLLYLETHVADICNLKCKGCMHFSNLATEANFPDLKAFERDFKRMRELFPNIYIIRLMGGEPLLNPRLAEYIEVVRHIFPAAEVRIVTNGLLISRQADEFWKVLKKNYVGVDISPYPPTIESIEEIKSILDREGIAYGTIASVLQKFRKSLSLTPSHDPKKSVKLCQSSHCHFLREGKVAKCPLPLLINDFNKVYQCKIESKDYFDIYEEKRGQELKEKLEGFADMCRYCPDKEAFIDWSRTYNDASIEDWIVEE